MKFVERQLLSFELRTLNVATCFMPVCTYSSLCWHEPFLAKCALLSSVLVCLFRLFANCRNLFNNDTHFLTHGNPITNSLSHTLLHALSVMHVLSLLPVGLIVHP